MRTCRVALKNLRHPVRVGLLVARPCGSPVPVLPAALAGQPLAVRQLEGAGQQRVAAAPRRFPLEMTARVLPFGAYLLGLAHCTRHQEMWAPLCTSTVRSVPVQNGPLLGLRTSSGNNNKICNGNIYGRMCCHDMRQDMQSLSI